MSDKLKKAKTKLVLTSPFFGCLLLGCNITADESVETAATDGLDIFYNPNYIKTLKYEEIMGLLAHQVGHKMFLHASRKQVREEKLWEIATDYVINHILTEDNLVLPAGFLHNSKYAGKTSEEVYKLLEEEANNDQEKNKSERDDAIEQAIDGKTAPDHLKKPPQQSAAERIEAEAEIKTQMAQAAQMAKQAGKLSESLAQFITEQLQPKVDWKKQLREFIMETAKNDYTYRRPNRRMMAHDMYLPSLTGNEMPPFAIAFDTSGSIYHDQKLLNTFVAEINSIIEDCSPSSVTVVYADSRVKGHTELEQGDLLVPNLQGGGGTAFSDTFNWIEAHETDFAGIIYFTDLYVRDYGESDTPTLWACYGNPNPPEVPFGQVIKIEEEA